MQSDAYTSVAATTPMISAAFMRASWMCTCIFWLKIEPSWWSVVHHVTEKWTIGTSMNAISAAIAPRIERWCGEPPMRRSAR